MKEKLRALRLTSNPETTMASVKGIKLVLKVGNGATPEVFTARCSLNAQRGIKFTADLQDTVIARATRR